MSTFEVEVQMGMAAVVGGVGEVAFVEGRVCGLTPDPFPTAAFAIAAFCRTILSRSSGLSLI